MSPPLSQRWSVDLGGTVSFPIIVGNRVFATGGDPISQLVALDAQSGAILWSQSVPQGDHWWAGLSYDNGMLFVLPPQSPPYTDGVLFAFSATDGHEIWSTTLPNQGNFQSAPTASNGMVYVEGTGYGTTVYAVREQDGALLWLDNIDENDSAPTVTSDGVYISSYCFTEKFSPINGELIWQSYRQCTGGGFGVPAIYQGLIYTYDVAGYPTGGITQNVANGAYVGSFTSQYSPAFWENTVFYTEPNFLTAVDLTTSLPLWVGVPDSGDSYACEPLVVDGVVYTGTQAGKFYGYSADNGTRLIAANLGSAVSCSEGPAMPLAGINAADGLLVVPAGSQLVAYQFTNFGQWQFVPTTPCRLLDTRQTRDPIQGGTSQSFTIPQLGGCNIPSSATAYSLNVTVVPQHTLQYLTVWPTAEVQPAVSTMNSQDGRVKANAAIVPAGYEDQVSVYASDTTDLILDINGYFTPPASGTYQFYPMTPCRVVDTRRAWGPFGQPRLETNRTRHFPILNSDCIPPGANTAAYSLNVTVVPNPSQQPLSYLTIWPAGQSQPAVSTLNNPTATVVANAAIVPAGSEGDIEVYSSNSTDLILDINGYFAAPGTGGLSLYPWTPCRVLDTRNGNGAFSGTLNPPVSVTGSICSPPSSAQAYVLNATVIPTGSLNYLTLWPDGQPQPLASTLNAWDGAVTSNMAIVPTNNGSIDAYASGLTQLILDISSYFAP